MPAYNKALAEGEEDAVEINKRLPGGNVPIGTPPKDWHIDQIAKIVVWGAKKLAGLAGIPSSISDTVIDAFAYRTGIVQKEASAQDKQYEDLKAKIEDLKRGQERIGNEINKSRPLTNLDKVSARRSAISTR